MSDPESLDCVDLIKLVSDYLEGTLPDRERERFEHHLQGCEGCRRYVHQVRTTVQISGTLSAEQIDPATREELLHLFRDWNRV